MKMKMALACGLMMATLISCTHIPSNASSSSGVTIKWEMFPDSYVDLLHVGDPIVFKLTPTRVGSTVQQITIHFGDEETDQHDMVYSGSLERSRQVCEPIHIDHTYRKPGLYTAYVTYEDGVTEEANGEGLLIVAPVVASDDELKERSFLDAIDNLEKGLLTILEAAKKASVKFAVVSALNANFSFAESEEDLRDVQIVKKVKNELVARGYSIIERDPQALISLAHESVRKKDEDGKDSGEYQDSLEYGLKTEYIDPSKPFVYAAKMEGMNDREENKEKSRLNSSDEKKSMSNPVGDIVAVVRRDGRSKESESQSFKSSSRPSLTAKFSMANYVITIERKSGLEKDIYITRSEPIYLDVEYQEKMIQRSAKIDFNARILDRSGRIVWGGDIHGLAEDRVIPFFVPKSDSTESSSRSKRKKWSPFR